MKNKIALFIVLPVLLLSCNSNSSNESSSFTGDQTLVLDYGFAYIKQNQKGEKLAELLLNYSYYNFSSEIKLDKSPVAGDQLSITFEGEYGITGISTGPGKCTVTGTVKSYQLLETQVICMLVDEASVATAIRHSGYVLDNEYVILDEEGRYTTLDEYPGSSVYLSYNQRKMKELCTCPEGAQCGPCPIYISQLYAYNPRPASN